ncbi:MAG TPA: hypothetical protein VLM79_19250 [Kofleriaceae bacterium]|nr:hypothetical protein [Kofleriaceae bacterium]
MEARARRSQVGGDGLSDDHHGRGVRLHEAVPVAQTRPPDPVAEPELLEAEAAQVARAE